MTLDRKQLLEILVTGLDRHLSPLGFKLSRRDMRFYLTSPNDCIVFELQRSSKSAANNAVVAVNIGLWNLILSERIGGAPQSKKLSAMDCHWWLRAGQMEDGQGRWWSIDSTSDLALTVLQMWALAERVISLFISLRSNAAFLQYLLDTQGPFLDPMNRWAFAVVLADSVGNINEQVTARHQLEEIGRSRTLPIGHRMLLQVPAMRG